MKSKGNMGNLGTVKKTGEKCPATGVWKIIHPDGKEFFIKEEQIFPQYGSEEVSWVLIHEPI